VSRDMRHESLNSVALGSFQKNRRLSVARPGRRRPIRIGSSDIADASSDAGAKGRRSKVREGKGRSKLYYNLETGDTRLHAGPARSRRPRRAGCRCALREDFSERSGDPSRYQKAIRGLTAWPAVRRHRAGGRGPGLARIRTGGLALATAAASGHGPSPYPICGQRKTRRGLGGGGLFLFARFRIARRP
jgi:hypothetical protein